MNMEAITGKLREKGMRVTPQRVAVFEAIVKLDNHPTSDNILEYVKKKHSSISTATIYKVLDSFVGNNLIKKVKTDNSITRYDPYLENHHHLYCTETNRIIDYKDDDLDELLRDYFSNKKFGKFKIEDINLQISGKFQ